MPSFKARVQDALAEVTAINLRHQARLAAADAIRAIRPVHAAQLTRIANRTYEREIENAEIDYATLLYEFEGTLYTATSEGRNYDQLAEELAALREHRRVDIQRAGNVAALVEVVAAHYDTQIAQFRQARQTLHAQELEAAAQLTAPIYAHEVAPGRYAITANIVYAFAHTNQQGQTHLVHIPETISVHVNAQRIMSQRQLVARAIQQFFRGKFTPESEPSLTSVTNVDITQLPPSGSGLSLWDIPMGALRLRYAGHDVWGNGVAPTATLATSSGGLTEETDTDCVLRYILTEIARTADSRYNRLTLPDLRTEFEALGGNNGGKGYTTRQVKQWAASKRNINVYAFDMHWTLFARHTAVERPRLVLFFMCNNRHCYPLLDTKLRAQVHNVQPPSPLTVAPSVPLSDELARALAICRGKRGRADAATPASRKRAACQLTLEESLTATAPTPDAEEGEEAAEKETEDTPEFQLQFEEVTIGEPDLASATVLPLPVPTPDAPDILATLLQALDALPADTTRVVLVPLEHLAPVLVHVIGKHRVVPSRIRMTQTRITAFVDPVTNITYVAAPEYEERRAVAAALYAELPLEELEWANQSWSVLALTMFTALYGDLPPSRLSTEAQAILDDYPVRAYRWREEHVPADLPVYSVDIRRCYTSILQSNDVPYAVYGPFDCARACTLTDASWRAILHSGEAYVTRTIYAAGGAMYRPPAWYPVVWVRHCLEHGLLAPADVTHVLQPSRTLAPDTFKGFADDMLARFPDASKQLINMLVGCLGTHQDVRAKVGITDDLPTALAAMQKGTAKDPQHQYILSRFQTINVVVQYDQTPRPEHHVFLNRHVLAAAWTRLDTLARELAPTTAIVGANTDSLKFLQGGDFNRDKLAASKAEAAPGEYWMEEAHGAALLGGSTLHDLQAAAPPPYNPAPFLVSWLGDGFALESHMARGIAGSGKSYNIARAVEAHPEHANLVRAREQPDKIGVVLTLQNSAAENLKKDGIPAHTFHRALYNPKYKRLTHHPLLRLDFVIVDECFAVPEELMALVHAAWKERGGELIVILTGDEAQVRAPTDHWLRYETNKEILRMCGLRMRELTYKFTRYDKPMYDALMELRKDGRITDAWPADDPPDVDFHITFHNALRKQLNAACSARDLDAAGPDAPRLELSADMTLWAGAPIMCYDDNDREAGTFKTNRFRVHSWDATKIYVTAAPLNERDTSWGTDLISLEQERVRRYFTMGYAATAHKIQSTTITDHYTVHEIECMPREVAYSALSRGVTLSKVHVPRPLEAATGQPAPLPAKPFSQSAVQVTITLKRREYVTYNVLVMLTPQGRHHVWHTVQTKAEVLDLLQHRHVMFDELTVAHRLCYRLDDPLKEQKADAYCNRVLAVLERRADEDEVEEADDPTEDQVPAPQLLSSVTEPAQPIPRQHHRHFVPRHEEGKRRYRVTYTRAGRRHTEYFSYARSGKQAEAEAAANAYRARLLREHYGAFE